MPTREKIIAEAYTWLGVPFAHQGRDRVIGVDCIGAMECVAKNAGVELLALEYTNYSALPDPRKMEAELDRRCDRVPWGEELPADIAWMRDPILGGAPRHLAMLTLRGTIIHAHPGVSNGRFRQPGRVVEVTLDANLRSKIVRFYRLRGIE